MIQQYIVNRIQQNPYNVDILNNSTPVICFGDLNKSSIATLGINSSNKEFVDNNNKFLTNNKLRFQNCQTLGQSDLSKLDQHQIKLIYDYCVDYFEHNPYREWFDVIEKYILTPLKISYYKRTCCHLDLIQWATATKWGELSKASQNNLLNTDFPFLLDLLKFQNIETILVNGISAFNTLKNNIKCEIIKDEKIYEGEMSCRMIKFKFFLSKPIVGFAWSQNLQSSRGLPNNMRNKIGNWVLQQINN